VSQCLVHVVSESTYNPFMATVPTDRLAKLQSMLEKSPSDTFLLYGIALEHKKQGDLSKAVELLSRVIEIDKGYCYAYHQRGLAYEAMGDVDAAKRSYRDGIQAAQDKGDSHAAGEITGALELLE
jgi:Flp pilus assembly protein TadD